MKYYKAKPLSIDLIKMIAKSFRNAIGIEPKDRIDPVYILEYLPNLFSGLNWEIVEDGSLGKNVHADYNVVDKHIRVTNSVYEGAYDGNGRDRMTIMHEISHYILIEFLGISFNRSYKEEVKVYEDPEWQAKCLAGELMAPSSELANMTVSQIATHYGISNQAAIVQKNRAC